MKKLGVVIIAMVFAFQAYSASVNISWVMPTNNVDGSSLTDLAGAKVYYGTTSSNYTDVIDVGLTNACTITGLVANTEYFFNGKAYGSTGRESVFCVEVAKTPVTNPMPLINFEVKIVTMITMLQNERDNLLKESYAWYKFKHKRRAEVRDELLIIDAQIKILKLVLSV